MNYCLQNFYTKYKNKNVQLLLKGERKGNHRFIMTNFGRNPVCVKREFSMDNLYYK